MSEAKAFDQLTRRDFEGHSKKVHSVAWNCSGDKLASGSVDKTARLWDVQANPGTSMELKGHKDGVHQLCWDPTSKDALCTASGDKTIKIWDARTGKCEHSIDTPGQNINVTWNANGRYIAVGNKKDMVSVVDTREAKIIHNHKFAYEVNEMTWSRNLEHFLVTTGAGTVEILKYPGFKPAHTLEAHTGANYCIELDQQNKYIATGGADAMVTIWDINELVCIRPIALMDSPVRSLSFSPDSRYIAIASEDFRIEIADTETGERAHTLEVQAEMNSVAWNPRSTLLAFAGDEKTKSGSHAGIVSVFGFPKQ